MEDRSRVVGNHHGLSISEKEMSESFKLLRLQVTYSQRACPV